MAKREDAELAIQSVIREHATVSPKDGELLNVSELSDLILESLENLGMLPPPDHVTPISIDGNNGIVLEVSYNHGPSKNPNKGIYQGWEDE